MVRHYQYTNAVRRAFAGTVTDLGDANSDVRLALLDATHDPDLDVHESWADVSADDIGNTAAASDGYTVGGQVVANRALASQTNQVVFDADDVAWSGVTVAAGYAVLYDATPGTDADKTLVTLVDFEGEQTDTNGDFTVSWTEEAIFEHTPRP